MMAEAAMKEVANSKLRRLLTHYNSFNRMDAQVSDPGLFSKAPSRRGSPRWRARATILGVGDTGVAAKY